MKIETFQNLLVGWMILALLLVPVQLGMAAPYGRHNRRSWRLQINNRIGWMLMEIVSPLSLWYWICRGNPVMTAPLALLTGLWTLHYFNRSIVFPLRIRTRGKQIPLAVVCSAVGFNLVNGFFNGYWWGWVAPPYPASWLGDPRFIAGALLFVVGAWINHRADTMLIALRNPGETGYRIPQGWLFRYISCPNHFGEILEWCGFAMMAWNLPALSFAMWTAANLVPRALAHHRWYRARFANYPPERKAIIPRLM